MHLLSPFSLNLPLYEHKKRPSYQLQGLIMKNGSCGMPILPASFVMSNSDPQIDRGYLLFCGEYQIYFIKCGENIRIFMSAQHE